MALPAHDDFDRANGGLGANWTNQINALAIVSNQCKGGTGGDYNQGFWNADTFDNDHYSQVNATSGPAGFGGIQVRASGTGGARNGYYILYGAGGGRMSKVVANTITDLIGPGGIGDPNNFDVVKMTVVGTTLKAYFNGVQQGSDQTDGSLSSGSPGIIIYDNNAIVDPWDGDNMTVARRFLLVR